MNRLQTFEEFITTHSGNISISGISINLVLTAVLCAILALFYVKYGQSLSNRKNLAKNFMLVGVTTCLVITIVKASLALSLGLVGALSIVRFRAAIKEPEELAFLFLTIAIGLGFGAGSEAADHCFVFYYFDIFCDLPLVHSYQAAERKFLSNGSRDAGW